MSRPRPTIAVVAFAAALGCGSVGHRPAPPPSAPVAAPARTAPAATAAGAFSESAPEYVFADRARRRKLEAAFPAIDALVESELAAQKLPSIAFGVVIDGELAYAKGFGAADLDAKTKPDADTVYRIGSITKSFTALAILSLRDEGKLTLDDPLTRWIPRAAGLVYPTRDAPPITLRELMTHRSGLPRLGRFDYTKPDVAPSEGEIVASLAGFPLENAPGTTFVYSNLGFALLGIVASHAGNAPLRQVVHDRLLGPLGMTSSTWDRESVPPAKLATGYRRNANGVLVPAPHWRLGASEGAGGLYSSLRDMARYVSFQLAAYPPRNAPEAAPIRRSSVREAHASALRSRGLRVRLRDAPDKGEAIVTASAPAYAFAWGVSETCDFDDLVMHNGAVDGFAASIAFLPDFGVGVVALSNFGDAQLDDLTMKALVALKKGGGLSRRVLDPKLAAGFDPAMKRFLSVYNTWDEQAYAAMLAKGRPQLPAEKDELAGYKSLHGACSAFAPVEIVSPLHARFAMQCERGRLEMEIRLGDDRMIAGFSGTSRDVPVPPKIDKVAHDITGLIKHWDEGVYKKRIAPDAKKTREETVSFFDKLRSAHGACSVKAFSHEPDKDAFALACERGSDLRLTLKMDDKNDEAVAAFSLTSSGGSCPVK